MAGIPMYLERKEFQGTWVLWKEHYWASCAKISLTWEGRYGWRNMVWILGFLSTSRPTSLLKIICWSLSTRTYCFKTQSFNFLIRRSFKISKSMRLIIFCDCYFLANCCQCYWKVAKTPVVECRVEGIWPIFEVCTFWIEDSLKAFKEILDKYYTCFLTYKWLLSRGGNFG